MPEFSITQALGAGFRLIGRNPLAVVAWGFLQLLITTGPLILLMAAIAPGMLSRAGDPAGTAAAAGAITMLQPIFLIASIVANAIVFSAIYRAVLTPQDDRALYLRLGRAEVSQGLLQAVLLVGMIILFFVVALVFAMMFGVAFVSMMAAGRGGAGQWPAVGLGGFLIGLGTLLVFWWLALRLSLSGPMTFADRQFRLFESWTMTKGQSLRLFGLSLLLLLMVLLLYIATILLSGVLMVVLALFLGGMANGMNPAGVEQMFAQWGAAAMIPLFLLVAAFGCGIYGMFLTVMIAPWAEVYRQLSGRTVDAETFA